MTRDLPTSKGRSAHRSSIPSMDFHAFASLAHVRVLLIPVGGIQRTDFEKCAAEIRTFDNIRLGDIPTDSKSEKGPSSSSRLPVNPFNNLYIHRFHSWSSFHRTSPSQFPISPSSTLTCLTLVIPALSFSTGSDRRSCLFSN